VLDDKDIAGNPPDILNKEGREFFNEKAPSYKDYNSLKWTDWEDGTTTQTEKELNSKFDIQISLPSFSFKKYEVRVIN
jgi:hypothetical protein